VSLTPRDLQIILAIYFYDGLVNKQIQRRFWGKFAAPRPSYRRLAQLIKAGFLRAARLPPATPAGSGPTLLTIGPASHPILKEALGLATADLRRLLPHSRT